MPKEGQFKAKKLSPKAQAVIREMSEAGAANTKISLAVYNATKEVITAQAIGRYRKNVLGKQIETLEMLSSLQDQLLQYAPKGWEGKDFGWLQGMLNAALKEKTADLLMNGTVKAEELLKYQDAAERRALERERLSLERLRMETERIKAEADIKNAETRAKEAELKIERLRREMGKPDSKKMSKADLEKIVTEIIG